MKRRLIIGLIAIIALILTTACQKKVNPVPYMIIPEPQLMQPEQGYLSLQNNIGLVLGEVREQYLEGGDEAYELKIQQNGIFIIGNSEEGVFYGMQTLDQILPPNGISQEESIKLPCVTIRDWPAFSWRGGMLDVSRHFFPKAFILKYIDILAFHKLNHFHWHLTDGVAWRLEIMAYPELTRGIDHYSQDDVREILRYAKSKHIEVIPEIEMPGHSEAALKIFPQLSCDPDEVSGVYCAGKEITFDFLEQVLSEVIDLFPAEFIHVGGDEVGKGHWKNCSDCQNRIKNEGLKNEEELQSYFIQRIEGFLSKHNKRLIGWDEILEGGLAPEASVMSWRGMQGGIEAANAGHDVVMSPGYPCYFDHYQSGHEDEPQAWGGLNGIRDVFGFNPIPDEIANEKSHHILGGQANLWTEQIAETEHAEYMMMPRFSALSEALWSGSETKNWERFEQKMILQLHRYEAKGYHYSESAFTPAIQVKLDQNLEKLEIQFQRELNLYPLHYTLDGSVPSPASPLYKSGEIVFSEGSRIRAQTFREGQTFGFPLDIEDLPNKATGGKMIYNCEWNSGYAANGDKALTDAQLATKRGDHPNWQGFRKVDLDIILDLQGIDTVSTCWIQFFQHVGMTSVLLPLSVEFYSSLDGIDYELIEEKIIPPDSRQEAMIRKVEILFASKTIRYIQIKARNPNALPKGHPRAGGDAWLFVDEIGAE